MKKPYVQASIFVSFAMTLLAQSAVQQFNAEVPDAFGSVAGRVVLAGDQLVFSSDSKPAASFSATRRDIQNISVEGNVIAIQLRNPIRDASGERTRLALRVSDQSATSAISSWFNRGSSSSAEIPQGLAAEALAGKEPSSELRSYQAHHQKKFGGSKGRLLVTNSGLAYESIDDVKDSRRWEFRDIKELKLHSPYELEVDPFTGDKYSFGVEGQGMSNGDYQDLIDRVTKARVAPRK
jgi:hypothetical protein